MNAGKNELLITAPDQIPNFLENERRRHTTAATAHGWNDAERAIRIAPILYFDHGACSTARAEVRRRLEFLFQKNAAAQNFGSTVGGKLLFKDVQNKSTDERFVRIPHDVADLRQVRQLFWRSLRIAARHDDLRVRI